MTFPAGLTTIEVTGLHLLALDGTPLSGTVIFTPSGLISDPALSLLLEGSATAQVTAGVMTPVTLPTTDCVSPGFAYTITQRLTTPDGSTGGPAPVQDVLIPSSLGASADLAALVPGTPPPPATAFNSANTWTKTQTFEGSPAIIMPGGAAAGNVWTSDADGNGSWQDPADGTVTSVTVESANGFAGTVADAGTTPQVTLETTVSGLLKGAGGALQQAVAGTDYVTPTGSGAGLSGITAAQAGADIAGAASGVASAITAELGQPSGIATLDSGGHVPAGQLPAATTLAQGAVVLDGTAGDIQASPGTQAAGAAGKSADAGHVHGQPPFFAPAGLTGATAVSRYAGATAAAAPVSGTFDAGDFVIDLSGQLQLCIAGGSPGSWVTFVRRAVNTGAVQPSPGTAAYGTVGTAADTGHVHGQPPMFAPTGLTGAVTPTRYVGGTSGGAPSTGTFVTGDFTIDVLKGIFLCITGGSPGTWNLIPFRNINVLNIQASPGTASTGGTNFAADAGHVHPQPPMFAPTGLAGATSATRYVGSTGAVGGAPVTGTFAQGDFITDYFGNIYICTAAGSPGTWAKLTVRNTNAANIQPVGAVAAAGAAGVNADASHVHAGFPVSVANGGTGQTAGPAAFNALNPNAAPAGYAPANPTGTTSSSLVMAGLALAYTPASSGILLVTVTGIINNTAAASNLTLGPRYGTGTAPSNGAAVTGTRFGPSADQEYRSAAFGGNFGQAFAVTGIISGLTPGTPYWIDFALSTATGGTTASLYNISAAIAELPAG